jgi:hypothetical protein
VGAACTSLMLPLLAAAIRSFSYLLIALPDHQSSLGRQIQMHFTTPEFVCMITWIHKFARNTCTTGAPLLPCAIFIVPKQVVQRSHHVESTCCSGTAGRSQCNGL